MGSSCHGAGRASFNPRPRMEGDIQDEKTNSKRREFQSTPSHGGRLDRRTSPHGSESVSIHALAWRATFLWKISTEFYNVSIHALAWRATTDYQVNDIVFYVSIHALAWRATLGSVCRTRRAGCFNPRPRMEGDAPAPRPIHTSSRFQSTPSHGGRLRLYKTDVEEQPFQSTPSHGGRLPLARITGHIGDVSIHALAWRATSQPPPRSGRGKVSIHALAWRATISPSRE